ncbi:uncharacterized protein LOC130648490 [Hydractinia symbiolongicarpus]|uniref:uncharacterized protein LOC130648490 n=1 Tax=Hydractinia symbiolongicarpus TaxID=13093 RepID=UPI00254B4A1B|nr:uncharacterized protein LOC130648490 [Hydractinia symbiolongicarpus]
MSKVSTSTFPEMLSIKDINLKNNAPGEYRRVQYVKAGYVTLNISNNWLKITEDHVFADLVSLNTLDLSKIQLKTFDNINKFGHTLPEGLFDNTINLNYLDSSGNKFEKMIVLKYLDLSQDRLKHVEKLLSENKNLEKIYLAENELKDISSLRLESYLKKLLKIPFRGNHPTH